MPSWVADFTYVPTWSGFVYVAFVIDAYSRRIVGWRAARSMTTDLVLDAVEHAFFTRAQEGNTDLRGLIAHSDAGAQYTSVAFTQRLIAEGVDPRSDRSVTRWTTRWPRPPSGRSRTNSSAGKAPGATSTRSRSPPPNGSSGPTPNVPTSTSTTSPPRPPRSSITITDAPQPWRGDSNSAVSGLTGTGHKFELSNFGSGDRI